MRSASGHSIPLSRRVELTALLLTDGIMLIAAFSFYYMAKFRWGWLAPGPEPAYPFLAMFILSAFWILVFVFTGLYRQQFTPSRLDELTLLFKVISLGSLVVFFVMFGNAFEAGSGRQNLLFYWATIMGFVGLGRVIVRSLQIFLLERGYGLRRALIVGWSERVQELFEEVARYPSPGLKIVGAIHLTSTGAAEREPAGTLVEVTVAGDSEDWHATDIDEGPEREDQMRSVEALPHIIEELGVQDLLIVLGQKDDQDQLLSLLQLCDGMPVVLKLIPDFYHMLGGMARTERIYGLPFIEVLPEPMRPWERSAKRLLDILVATCVLLVGLPAWAVVAVLIRATSHGPAIYRQERVGRNGRIFTMYKFRTMHEDAEHRTGPVWATEDDPRYTRLGRWLRKMRIDEVPQLLNVLSGNMSLVGPRPERPFFVQKLAEEIPLYRRRLRVKPGITGIAQIKWKYDNSVDDVRQKVRYDLLYISNMSLRLDLKILLATLRIMLLGRGH